MGAQDQRDEVARALGSIGRVPAPSMRLSPLEEEVADLARVVLDPKDAERLEPSALDRDWFADVAVVVIDAVLARDKLALDRLDTLLRQLDRALAIAQEDVPEHGADSLAHLGRCEAWSQLTMEYARAALERVAPVAAAAAAKGTHYERFLRIVAVHPGVKSRRIRTLMDAERNRSSFAPPGASDPPQMDEGQLSRVGAKLRAQGLVFSQRAGQGLSWELTPRGRLVVDHLLGINDHPDRPVERMVIATKEAAPAHVVAEMATAKPQTLKVLRQDETVTYERREPSDEAVPAQRPNAPERPVVPAVDLISRVHPDAPMVLTVEDGLVYDKVEQFAVATA
jgi:hypothetical protein